MFFMSPGEVTYVLIILMYPNQSEYINKEIYYEM